jgi:hypothetical protein
LLPGLSACNCCNTEYQRRRWYLLNFAWAWWTISRTIKHFCQKYVPEEKQ